jgi:hypothetical protein
MCRPKGPAVYTYVRMYKRPLKRVPLLAQICNAGTSVADQPYLMHLTRGSQT